VDFPAGTAGVAALDGAEVAVVFDGVVAPAGIVVVATDPALVELWDAGRPADELSGSVLLPAHPAAPMAMTSMTNPQARRHLLDVVTLITTSPVWGETGNFGLGRRARRIDRRPSPDLNRLEAEW
jgi:hypothetical protein